jgi:hypothetical protein
LHIFEWTGCILDQIYLLFIVLQQNIDVVRVGNAIDIVGEKIVTDTHSEDIHMPLGLYMSEAEPKLNLVCI